VNRPRPALTLGLAVLIVMAACGGGGPAPPEGPSPAGPSLWVLNNGSATVARVDPNTLQVTASIPVGAFPTSISAGGGFVWVANAEEGTVSKIDPATNEVVATLDLGDAREVLFAEDALWVSQGGGLNALAKVDPASGEIVSSTELDMEFGPGALAFGGGSIWASPSLTTDEEIARIDPATGEVQATIGNGKEFDSMWGFAFEEERPAAWAAGIFTDGLWGIGLDTDAPEVFIEVPIEDPQRAFGVAFGAGSVWAPTSGSLIRIEPTSGSTEAEIEIGADPTSILFADGFVWVADEAGSAVYRVDPATNEAGARIAIPATLGPEPGPTGPTPTTAEGGAGPYDLAFG